MTCLHDLLVRSTLDETRLAQRSAIQPQYYPSPAFQAMNPGTYALSGSQFTQPDNRSGYSAPASSNGTPVPMPSQFAYPAQYSPTSHGYYPPFNPQMLMYAAAPPQQRAPSEPAKTPAAPSPVPAPTTTGKRKRKSNVESAQGKGDSDQEAGGSGSDRPRATSQSISAAAVAEMKKRTKTQRACDSCRSRKIRFGFNLASYCGPELIAPI